jgi:hypothetical protein
MGKLAPSDILQVRTLCLNYSKDINEVVDLERNTKMQTPASKLIEDARAIELYLMAGLVEDDKPEATVQ